MADVVCMSHRGIRCAILVRDVLSAISESEEGALVRLWDGIGHKDAGQRVLDVRTAVGPRTIDGSDMTLISLPSASIHPLSPLLRAMLPLPHVVGVAVARVADEDDELIWLVDTRRFHPDAPLTTAPDDGGRRVPT